MEQLIRQYFTALQQGSYDGIMAVVEPDASVHSPLYGTLYATKCYADLFQDTAQSVIVLEHILSDTKQPTICAGHFQYTWTMKDQSVVEFDCVDLFRLSEQGKIAELHIIYETVQARSNFNQLER